MTVDTSDAQADLTSVHLITLGCARNDVDSEELAARLEAGGFRLVDEADGADAVMVNTCGFVEAAKKDSVDTLLAAADLKADGGTQAVVAVGCMAERYGNELAESLPEADAVLSFDDYTSVAERLQSILAGERHTPHVPRDRRTLLPLSPVDRSASTAPIPGHGDTRPEPTRPGPEPTRPEPEPTRPEPEATRPEPVEGPIGPASGPRILRRRLEVGPCAPLKLASGCDRRCTFCAIPRFRGAYVSRTPDDILAEARWLAEQGVREAFLVSENSSSYGKDLGDIRLLEKLLPELDQVDGLDWIRVSYLQPAEMRPGLVEAMTSLDRVVPYFDLSFQHASGPVLRRMRRFGDAESFLTLIDSIRAVAPEAGIRSNVICGFPGETEGDVQILADFLTEARLDAIGVFGYSDEDGTEAAGFTDQLPVDEVEARRTQLADLADELVGQRAEERVGERLTVLIEEVDTETGLLVGRAEHQGPEVDGCVEIELPADGAPAVGALVMADVIDTQGVDLVAELGEVLHG